MSISNLTTEEQKLIELYRNLQMESRTELLSRGIELENRDKAANAATAESRQEEYSRIAERVVKMRPGILPPKTTEINLSDVFSEDEVDALRKSYDKSG